jgi:hypothetical protein
VDFPSSTDPAVAKRNSVVGRASLIEAVEIAVSVIELVI